MEQSISHNLSDFENSTHQIWFCLNLLKCHPNHINRIALGCNQSQFQWILHYIIVREIAQHRTPSVSLAHSMKRMSSALWQELFSFRFVRAAKRIKFHKQNSVWNRNSIVTFTIQKQTKSIHIWLFALVYKNCDIWLLWIIWRVCVIFMMFAYDIFFGSVFVWNWYA